MNKLRDRKRRVISIDVQALYPSMTWEEIVCSVKEMIMRSLMIVENVNWREVGEFIAVNVPQEEIETEWLALIIPKRKKLDQEYYNKLLKK